MLFEPQGELWLQVAPGSNNRLDVFIGELDELFGTGCRLVCVTDKDALVATGGGTAGVAYCTFVTGLVQAPVADDVLQRQACRLFVAHVDSGGPPGGCIDCKETVFVSAVYRNGAGFPVGGGGISPGPG